MTHNLEAIRRSVKRGTLDGSTKWIMQSATRLQLKDTLRSGGRPMKHNNDRKRTEEMSCVS